MRAPCRRVETRYSRSWENVIHGEMVAVLEERFRTSQSDQACLGGFVPKVLRCDDSRKGHGEHLERETNSGEEACPAGILMFSRECL